MSVLTVENDGAVCRLTLNRPERLNAINPELGKALWSTFRDLENDYRTRIVVIRGAGRAFCAGLDVRHAAENPDDLAAMQKVPESAPDWTFSEIIRLMRRCPQPIISLIHGEACGGGFAMALASDIRLAGKSARMNDAFLRIGMSGCELGLSYFLPRTVGLSVASELMMTGAFIDGERALQVGLVSRCVPDEDLEQEAQAMIDMMLQATPMGLRKTKETLTRAMRLNDLDSVIDLEEHAQHQCNRSGNFDEGLRAFSEKREPRYRL